MFNALPTDPDVFLKWEWSDFEPYYYRLLDTNLTIKNIDQWLKDWSAVSARFVEMFSRLSVAKSQDTTDQEAEKRFFHVVEAIRPEVAKVEQKLKEELLSSGLIPTGMAIPIRNMRQEVEIFHEDNLPLETEENKFRSAYDKINGTMSVTWQGEERTPKYMEKVYLDEARAIREQAWRVVAERMMESAEAIGDNWKQLLKVRKQIAHNAGDKNYRDYRWKLLCRFDYTPEDCESFHAAIREVVVPAAERMYERRRQQLGVDMLRPWDLFVDALHREPLKPFKDVSELESKAEGIFRKVDPDLGEYYATMRREHLLDLPNRPNKALGGYCTGFPVAERPFIFMNAVGLNDDVQTLMHESGHSFHVFESTQQPYLHQQDYPAEFAEVASMSMELLTAPYLSSDQGGFYSKADAARARIEHLEGIIQFWPYMATMDAFQHWVYTHDDEAADPQACDEKWLKLWNAYMRGVSMEDLGDLQQTGWHGKQLGWRFKLHIHRYPFYYVEYGLAQLGAVQVWQRSLEDPAAATAHYRQALALGGTAALPDLYRTAGARLAFDAETLGQAVALLEKTIDELSVQ